MKTLKWFSLEWLELQSIKAIFIFERADGRILTWVDTEQQAFDWLEANGYIERVKES